MKLIDAKPEDIKAMQARFLKSQLDRKYEAQMDQVVRMVGKKKIPFVPAQSLATA